MQTRRKIKIIILAREYKLKYKSDVVLKYNKDEIFQTFGKKYFNK